MFKPPFIIPVTKGPQLWSDTMQLPATTRIELISKNELTSEQFALAMELARKEISANLGVIKRVYLGQRQNSDISNLGYVSTFTPLSDSVGLQYVRNTGAEYLTLVVKAEAFLPSKKEEKTLPGAELVVDVAWFVDRTGAISGDQAFLEGLWNVWWPQLTSALIGTGYTRVRHGLYGLNAYLPEVEPKFSGFAVLGLDVASIPSWLSFNEAWQGGLYGQAIDAIHQALTSYDIGWQSKYSKFIVIITNPLPTGGVITAEQAKKSLDARSGYVVWANYTPPTFGAGSYLLEPGVSISLDYGTGLYRPEIYAQISAPILAEARRRLSLYQPKISSING